MFHLCGPRPPAMTTTPSLKPLNLRCKIHSSPTRCSKLANNSTKNSLSIMDHHRASSSTISSKASSHSESAAAEDIINSQKLDQWVRNSAAEIVKKLDEAPFLVHIYCWNGNTSMIKMVTEKGVVAADSWPTVEERWKKGETPTPNGVILVEQLISKTEEECSSTKLWGILIQAKGKATSAACYLLKTSRVQCATHFCLSRVESFVEHPDVQLQNLWLLHHSFRY